MCEGAQNYSAAWSMKRAARDKIKPRRANNEINKCEAVSADDRPNRKIHNVFVPLLSAGTSGSQCCCKCTIGGLINGS